MKTLGGTGWRQVRDEGGGVGGVPPWDEAQLPPLPPAPLGTRRCSSSRVPGNTGPSATRSPPGRRVCLQTGCPGGHLLALQGHRAMGGHRAPAPPAYEQATAEEIIFINYSNGCFREALLPGCVPSS